MRHLLQPLVLWGDRAPAHTITAILLADDQTTIVTGSKEGQICLWELSCELKISPRTLLFGHSSSITCLSKARDFDKQPYIVSATENGEMCLWNVTNGQCIENTKLPYVHTSICYYYCSFRMSGDGWLICCGQYQDVLVIDAQTLEVLHTFVSSQSPDWVSCMCVIHSPRIQEDSLVVVSVTGSLKVWDLSSSIHHVQEKESVSESESKSLHCRNCRAVRFCSFTQRFLLIVCSSFWQVYDYCDFSLLCHEVNRNDNCLAGGEILAANKLIIWTEHGHGYIYQLPDRWTQMGATHEKFSGLFKNGVSLVKRNSVSISLSPRLLCTTVLRDKEVSQNVMGFMNERKDPFYKILFSGESSGRITLWLLPDVPIAKSDGSPEEIQVSATSSLQDVFEECRPDPNRDADCDGTPKGAVTTGVYIPNYDKLVCGYEDGKIIITIALHTARERLLDERSLLNDWLPHRVLNGHNGAVSCLLYPFTISVNFSPTWLVSGGHDSCVILWDMFTGEALHKFILHASTVIGLSAPADESSVKFASSVCCLTSDHSIALLHLQEKVCLMRAQKHLFPVTAVKLCPLEDVLLVGCEDESLYVWEIETGTLDRYETGENAKRILRYCEEFKSTVDLLNPMPALSIESFRKRHAGQKNSVSFKFGSPAHSPTSPDGSFDKVSTDEYFQSPLSVLPMKEKWNNNNFHILMFDLEKLLELIWPETEETIKTTSSLASFEILKKVASAGEIKNQILKRNKTSVSTNLTEAYPKSPTSESPTVTDNNVMEAKTEKVVFKKLKPKFKSTKKIKVQSLKNVDINVTTDTIKLLLSCLFPWGVDKALDELCVKKLGIFMLQCPASFGVLSKEEHLSLMLPACSCEDHGRKKLHGINQISEKVVDLANKYISAISEESTYQKAALVLRDDENFENKAMLQLFSRIYMVNRLMKSSLMEGNINAGSLKKMESVHYKRNVSSTAIASTEELTHSQHIQHSLDMDTGFPRSLVLRWQTQSVQVLEAVQAVLLAEVQILVKTFRRASVRSKQMTLAKTEMYDNQEVQKAEFGDHVASSYITDSVFTPPVSLAKHDSALELAKLQEIEDMPDGYVCKKSDSPVRRCLYQFLKVGKFLKKEVN
ncbi:WD repeat-containing protein 72 [Protopterus annectens]|uniref:WD repeat-containing protein 72 n=1 Tax=Protopterus annectens TaxID=7888 RepID=UPI001CF954B4|nr:WD repeat-containing protein 72 [Protopterus annectens]